jgi:hypothetical protein
MFVLIFKDGLFLFLGGEDMDFFEDVDKKQLMWALVLLLMVFGVIVFFSIGNTALGVICLSIFVYVFLRLSPVEMAKVKVKRVSSRVRYRIHHCDLELSVYSSKFHLFIEKIHPLDQEMSIDFRASYKRHYIKASLDEDAFIYHEEVLVPMKKSPVTDMFKGIVVEFELAKSISKELYINHPLFNDKYPRNYIYLNGKKMAVYIESTRFVEQAIKDDKIEENIKELITNLREIIQLKNEFLVTYEEEKHERTE